MEQNEIWAGFGLAGWQLWKFRTGLDWAVKYATFENNLFMFFLGKKIYIYFLNIVASALKSCTFNIIVRKPWFFCFKITTDTWPRDLWIMTLVTVGWDAYHIKVKCYYLESFSFNSIWIKSFFILCFPPPTNSGLIKVDQEMAVSRF